MLLRENSFLTLKHSFGFNVKLELLLETVTDPEFTPTSNSPYRDLTLKDVPKH